MCISAVLMRIVGVAFNVYVSNSVGAEAMGLFSLITSVWGFALTLATSGINLAVTRCVAEARGSAREISRVMRSGVFLALSFGCVSSLLLLILSSPICRGIVHEPRILLPLRLTAISLPAISLTSAFNGYYSAVRRVWKSALCQVSEQTVKIFSTAALFRVFLPLGAEYACVALVLGCVAADLASCLLSSAFYLFGHRKAGSGSACYCAGGTTKKLLSVSMPVALSAYIRSGLTTVEHIIIPIGLVAFGGTRSEALADYGIITGMVLPVVLFPYAFIYSVTGLLVPEVAGSAAENRKNRISYLTTRMWRLTLLFGFACAGVMTVCSRELGRVLYDSDDAARYIRMLAPLLPVMYLDTVTDSLLKGIGEQVYTMMVNIVDASLSVLLVWMLLPRFGMVGYIAVLYISELINFAFSAARLLARTHFHFDILRWLLLPLGLLAAASRLCVHLYGRISLADVPAGVRLGLHGVTLLCLFALLLRLTRCVDAEFSGWLKKTVTGKEASSR